MLQLSLLTLWVAHRLIDTQNSHGSFSGGSQGILFYQSGFPHEIIISVGDTGGSIDTDTEMASFLVFSVFLAQLVHHVNGVQSGILGNSAGDHFQGSGEGVDDQLLLARDGAGVVTQVAGEFHFDSSTTSHNR